MDAAIEERLKKGAGILGEYWRAGERCAFGWGIRMAPLGEDEDSEKAIERWACQCETKTRFCKTKVHWVKLALMELRLPEEGPYGIPLLMTASEWDLTGLTMKVEIPDVGPLTIGPKAMTTMAGLLDVSRHPGLIKTMYPFWKTMPGAKFEGVIEPTPIAAAVAAAAPAADLGAAAAGDEPFE
jgi:hypothetical protein